MDEVKRFFAEVAANVEGLSRDKDVQALSRIWVREIARHGPWPRRDGAGVPAIGQTTEAG